MKPSPLTTILALCTTLHAATGSSLVIPLPSNNQDAGTLSYTFASQPSIRLQEVYAGNLFPQQTIRISEIRWRRDQWQGSDAFGSISGVSLSLSTTLRAPNALSSLFADNLGTDATMVFTGKVEVPPPVELPAGADRPFDIAIHLDQPFRFDPTQGNLLLDIRVPSPMGGWLGVDCPNGAEDGASRVFSWGVDDAGGPTDVAADLIEVVYDPDLPAEPFTLRLTADTTQLWPPNGQRVPVTLTAVGQTADGRLWPYVEGRITSVTCNEVYGKAARDKRNPQWIVTDDLSLSLVAKKLPGRMHMRVYTITVQADGLDGFTGTGQIQVVVPAAAPQNRR